ncbi:MAG TPA: HXXEE domain-containing protein [Actinomycetes bacterium]
MTTSPATVPRPVTWGLLAAWAVHDLEELATMAPALRRIVARLRPRYPQLPDGVWERLEVSPAHVAVAIGLMGTVMTTAAVAGARSGGRSGFYQAVLAGFGWHAVGHVAQSIAVGGYASGVVTAPVVVAPFSVWAWRRLRAAGVPAELGRSSAWGMVLLPVTLGAAHFAAHRLTRRIGAAGGAFLRSR